MFLRQLSSSSSSFLPRSRPALCRAGFRSSSATSSYLPHFPAPFPWWSVRGFPPRPPRLPHPHPAAPQVFSGRTLHPRSINPGNFSGTWRSFNTSATLMMERPDRDREPPHKRRKSAGEKRSVDEREGHRGGAAGPTGGKNGGSKREQHHLDSSTDNRPRPNHRFKDGSRDRGNNESGKGVSRANSRDKNVERIRSGDKHRHWKDGAGRDETTNRGRSAHQRGGHKDSQPERTQAPQSEPEQGKVPLHKHNAWFKGRGAEEQGGCERDTGGREGQLKERTSDGGRWTGFLSPPCSNTLPPNPWQVAGATRQPPPPGDCPPVRQQEDVQPVKCKFSLLRRFCII